MPRDPAPNVRLLTTHVAIQQLIEDGTGAIIATCCRHGVVNCICTRQVAA